MEETKPNTNLFHTKQHFAILDGLRGVAALAVVIFHFMEWVRPDFSKNFIAHGFLAVDFFFCLSGFVIGYAYDDRIRQRGTKEFLKARMIRLHPLLIFGSVLGLIAFFLDSFALPVNMGTSKLILLAICSALLILLPVMEERFFNLFAFNAPAWSLFWEYVANIVYAIILYRLNRRWLGVLLLAAAVALCFVSFKTGNLLGGWSKDNFLDGGARVAYSFSAGLFLFRAKWIVKNRLGFLGLSILLSFAFLMPWTEWNWLTEALVVVFYFPLIVSPGAGSSLSLRWKEVCHFSGNLSYPLYMTHYAAIWIFGNYFTNQKPGDVELIVVIIFSVAFLLAFAYLVMKFFDEPVRKFLTEKLIVKNGERIN